MFKFFKWFFNVLSVGLKGVYRRKGPAPLVSQDNQTAPAVLLPIINHPGRYVFFCPGCSANHVIDTTPSKKRAYHTLSGTLAHPTIRASVMSNPYLTADKPRCHSFITNGEIEYLDDSTHALAGKTVSLPPL
jgi:hypothetical protein